MSIIFTIFKYQLIISWLSRIRMQRYLGSFLSIVDYWCRLRVDFVHNEVYKIIAGLIRGINEN